jgi:hypothetical protein
MLLNTKKPKINSNTLWKIMSHHTGLANGKMDFKISKNSKINFIFQKNSINYKFHQNFGNL